MRSVCTGNVPHHGRMGRRALFALEVRRLLYILAPRHMLSFRAVVRSLTVLEPQCPPHRFPREQRALATTPHGFGCLALSVSVLFTVGCDRWPFAPKNDICGVDEPAAVVLPEARWWKGNLHTHTLWSDGDDYPETVIDWYKAHGYQFLGLSEHNNVLGGDVWIEVSKSLGGWQALQAYYERSATGWVDQREINGSLFVRLKTFQELCNHFEEPNRFLLIRSEEITDQIGTKQVHVNAINLADYILPQGGRNVLEVLQNNVSAVTRQQQSTGRPILAHVNHPNLGWAVSVDDLIALRSVRFFEIHNGHPGARNEGNDHRPSTERMWDLVLTGRLTRGDHPVYAVAVDDAHNYRIWDAGASNPGRGWVMVRARRLTPEAIVRAMEAGSFYASTGVTLQEISVKGDRFALTIRPEPNVSYTTLFMGTRWRDAGLDNSSPGTGPMRRVRNDVGLIFAEVAGTSPSYTLQGDEMYVRAKVISSKASANSYRRHELEVAWTQPHIPKR